MQAVNKTDKTNGASIIYALNSDTVKTVEITGPNGDVFATSNSSILNPQDIVKQLERSKAAALNYAKEYQATASGLEQKLQDTTLTQQQRTRLEYQLNLAQNGASREAADATAIDAAIASVQSNFDSNFAQLEQQLKDNPSAEETAAEDTAESDTADADEDIEQDEDNEDPEDLDDEESSNIDDEEDGDQDGDESDADWDTPSPEDPDNEASEVNSDESSAEANRLQAENDGTSSGNTAPKKYRLVDNPLHDFASYTYQLALHALSDADYNRLVDNDAGWKPTSTLIVSAGRRGNEGSGFERNPIFYEDFYFNDFKMTTIVGLNNGKKSTNAVDIAFTLFEPTGLTLINRLVDVSASAGIGAKNYLEMPYLLEIDFHGYTDLDDQAGAPIQLLDQRKYIPIRITEMKIKVGVNGAEYACKAIPFNHQAFNDSVSATPANFEVSAKNLQQFFENTVAENVTKQKEREEQEKKELDRLEKSKATPELTARESEEIDKNIAAKKEQLAKDGSYAVTSYTAAYNAWQKAAAEHQKGKNQQQITYNEVRVVFSDEILANDGGTMVIPEEQSVKKVPMANAADPKQVQAARRANAGAGNSGPDFQKGTFNMYMGTSVMEVINIAMRNSKFIRDQVKDPTQEGADAQKIADKMEDDKPLIWWKIVPHIKLKDFDPDKNKYSKIITYYVNTHEYYNRKHPYGPQGLPKGWVKKYRYMYTGQNRDVLDFNIDFDTLYYTAINIDRGKSTATQGTKQGGSQEDELSKQGDTPTPKPNSASPIMRENVAELPAATGSGDAKRDSKTQAVAGLANDIYSGSRGDMINLKVKIIGDPTFIKQDDIFINPGQAQYDANVKEDPVVTKNNSIRTDTGEIHCLVEFYSPTDRDEYTGLLTYEGRWRRSLFSGIYRILTVESTFSKGKFEQSLDMIRLFNQPEYDYEIKRDADMSKERQPDQTITPEADTEPLALPETADYTELQDPPDTGEEEDFDDPDQIEEEDPDNEPELLNPDDEDEYNELNNDLEDAEEQDIDDWDEDNADSPEDEEAVLDTNDEDTEESDVVEQLKDDEAEARRIVEESGANYEEFKAQSAALAAQINSDDPREQAKAVEHLLEQTKSFQAAADLPQQFYDTMLTAYNSEEFQTNATDQEKAEVAAAIAEIKVSAEKANAQKIESQATYEKTKAEFEAYKQSPEFQEKLNAYLNKPAAPSAGSTTITA